MKRSIDADYRYLLTLLFDYFCREERSLPVSLFNIRNCKKLLNRLDNHLLSLLFHRFISEAKLTDRIPAELKSGLDDRFKIYNFRDRLYIQGIERIAGIISEFNHVMYKGIFFERRFYGGAWPRPFGDIDILVEEEALPDLIYLLFQNGFTRYSVEKLSPIGEVREINSYEKHKCEINFCDSRTGTIFIDLHWNALSEFKCGETISGEMLSTREGINFNGIQIYSTSDEYALLLSLFNALKHRFYHLLYFFDLFLIYRKVKGSEEGMNKLINRYRLGNLCRFITFLREDLFKDTEIKTRSWTGFERNIFSGAVTDIVTRGYPKNPLFYLYVYPGFHERYRYIKSRLFPDYYDLKAHFGRGRRLSRTLFYIEKARRLCGL
ncbi:MAG TPA: hypothetical protein ENN73_04810 [Firmicutes bacterium]|nr:hypothetical protein [Bacillota bacterium]